ncbi:MAG: DHH family phosphoesterase, partial [Lachnospiraceae bacterium]|nr:DHH family phosphoesterase [Lachnospiraceae bacterium]
MKQKVKLKGHLKAYLQTSLILGILLALVNAGVYFLDILAGVCVSGFLLIYLITMLILLYRNKPVIMNEFVNFATQYGQVQKTLLRDLDLPHVLMDDDGKIIWTNAAFERVIHKDKGYRKSIGAVFPAVTKDKLEFEQDAQIDVVFEEHEYIFRMKRISIKDVLDNSEVVERAGNENFLIAG